ncbi:ribosome recycling factor [Patescibacteria group bacterium]|nr:ribosome recycling factor [Patescibacteria group bacterium]
MYEQKIIEGKQEMEKALDYLSKEFSKLRVGKASPSLIEDLAVDYYGVKTPLKQLATINVVDIRLLAIQPYDKGSLKAIEGVISQSDLGLSCSAEKDVVRVTFPEPNEERRQELAKVIGQKAEEAKIIVRNAREKIWKEIKDLENTGQVTEDDKYKAQEELDKVVNEINNQIKEREEKKEQEVMTV